MKRWICLLALVIVGCSVPRMAKADSKPNVIYIIADDLGYADMGFQGISKDVKTPNIDAIAAAGVRFTNGYVSCPVCSPTRAGLMTGRYQQRFGHETNPGPNQAENFGLPTDQVTLPQALKAAGYTTGMVGKWHLGFQPEMLPTSRGFDEFYGFLGGAHGYNDVGKGTNAIVRGEKPVDQVEYLTDAFGKEATAFVEKHAKDEKPFFLYLAFNAIHTPLQSPAKYMDRYADEKDIKRKTMLAMLSAMDDAVGQVTAALEKSGEADNTLIIYHTDNGGPTQGNGSRNEPHRGTKGSVYEGGVRVPFTMKWKAKLAAGKTYENPVIALDMFPTILAAAGVETPTGVKFDGVDLLPHLLGTAGENAKPHQDLFWRFGPQWAVRSGNLKLLKSGPKAVVELYDLAADVGEQKNLAAEKPEVAKQLQATYDAWSAQMEKPRWKDSREDGGKGKGQKGKKRRGKGKNASQTE